MLARVEECKTLLGQPEEFRSNPIAYCNVGGARRIEVSGRASRRHKRTQTYQGHGDGAPARRPLFHFLEILHSEFPAGGTVL